MILYSPTSGDVYDKLVRLRPRTAFLMTQLGRPVPPRAAEIRRTVRQYLRDRDIDIIDAGTQVTGKDFMDKIFDLIVSVPMGIAIVTAEMKQEAVANIHYELGIMQALGKETVIVKTPDAIVPSDLVRTEYIDYERGFRDKVNKYIDKLIEIAEYYADMAVQLRTNSTLAIDYLKRAYLITGRADYRERIAEVVVGLAPEPS